jgi:hypothetical protein
MYGKYRRCGELTGHVLTSTVIPAKGKTRTGGESFGVYR